MAQGDWKPDVVGSSLGSEKAAAAANIPASASAAIIIREMNFLDKLFGYLVI